MSAQLSIRLGLLVLAAAVATSVITDLRRRLILNWVTLPALAAVLVLFSAGGGWPLLQSSVAGMAVCALPLLLAALPGWIGMGDVKLMALCGAAAGFPAAITVLVLVSVAGGLQAGLQLLWARVHGAERPRYVPYACSIAAGTVAAFLLGDRLR